MRERMNETEQILSQLHDIRLPPAPEGVAPWLIAANLVLFLIVLAGLYCRWKRKRNGWRHDALRQVRQARSMEPTAAILTLAKLLRQIMLYRQYDISADGPSWLANLDEAFHTQWFSQSEGQAFGRALYRPTTISDEELQRLCKHLERLIRRLPSRKHNRAHLHDRLSAP